MGEIPNRFDILINKIYYIHERYGVDATFALLYHTQPLDVDTLGGMMRRSDEIIKIDETHAFIIFTFTPQKNAIKASENLLQKLDRHLNNRSSCIALDSFDTSKSPRVALSRLKQILAEIQKHSYTRIDNESILDGCM